jgi:hypothetical protein
MCCIGSASSHLTASRWRPARAGPFPCPSEGSLGCPQNLPTGTAGGRDGLAPLHIKHALSVGGSDLLLDSLLGVVNRALAGDIPQPLRSYWASAPITPRSKPNGGMRPIAVGLTLRRLVSKIAVAAVLPAVSEYLQPHPLHCPSIWQYVAMTYGCAAHQYVGPHVVDSTTGVQQGDPLSPLLFALTVQPLLLDIHRECPDVHQGWYWMTARSLVPCPQRSRQSNWLLTGPRHMACLNPHNAVCSPRQNPHLHGFPWASYETRAGLIVLGAAVTVSVAYAASVAQAQVDAVAASLQRLSILRHPQAELLLLRSCLGTCKVVFTARTMPPAAAEQALVTFDMLQTQVLQSIVTAGGGGFGPLQQTLAGLPIAQGGLGITKATSLLPVPILPPSRRQPPFRTVFSVHPLPHLSPLP